jgi:nitroimidazol reductase NimA-like FMN-containing flavoprotein (pyridoxamine 5'-phosphate oxidase superfamily)
LKEITAFLDNEWIACIATLDDHNRLHIVPLWFTYDDSKVDIQTDRKSVKAKDLLENPNVAVAVYDDHDEAAVIRGGARKKRSFQEIDRTSPGQVE